MHFSQDISTTFVHYYLETRQKGPIRLLGFVSLVDDTDSVLGQSCPR